MFTYFAKQIYRERDGETKSFIQLAHSLCGSGGGGGGGGGGGAVGSAVCTSFLQHHVVQTYLESTIKYKIQQQQQQKCTRQLHNDSSIVNLLTSEKEGLQRGKLDLAVSDSRLTHSLG